MSINDVSNLFTFAGGLGMFLYGMRIMGDGMQKTAGSKMNHFLGMVTNNRLLGVALGALITAILHSSAATTVMVVGFVNAGILNLTQAVGVIMGANIGLDGFFKSARRRVYCTPACIFCTSVYRHRYIPDCIFKETKK